MSAAAVATWLAPASAAQLRAIREELDDVRRQVRALSDRLLPSFQGAGVSVEPLPREFLDHLGIATALIVRQVREGSPAERRGLQAGDLLPGMSEPQLVEAIQGGRALEVLRRGKTLVLSGR